MVFWFSSMASHRYHSLGGLQLAETLRVGKAIVLLVQGDITDLQTDAIVNAANSSLMGGGGVDGAIHFKGGPKILKECKEIRLTQYPNGLPAGQAVLTSGGNLKAKWVIHTVGPVWTGGKKGERDLLQQNYLNSLRLAVKNGMKTIAFPSISTGAYGYPIERAGRVALETVKEFLEGEDKLSEVIFVLFSAGDFQVYKSIADKVFA